MVIKATLTLIILLCFSQSLIAQIVSEQEANAICAMISAIPKLVKYPHYWNSSKCLTPCNFPRGILCDQNSIISVEIYTELDYPLLTGNLPTQIGLLVNINTFDVGENSLTGTIPTQIGLLTSITYLHLHDNYFNGTIPTQLGNLKNITNMDLGNNKLTGTVPTQLANLPNLEYIGVYTNQLFLCDIEEVWKNYTGYSDIYENLAGCPPPIPQPMLSPPPQPMLSPPPQQEPSLPPQQEPPPQINVAPQYAPQYTPQANILVVQNNSNSQVSNTGKNIFDSVNLNQGSSLSVSDTTVITGNLSLSSNTSINLTNSTINVGNLLVEGSFRLSIVNGAVIPIQSSSVTIKENTTLVIRIEKPTVGTTVVMTFIGVDGKFENILVEGVPCARAMQTRNDVSIFVPLECVGYSNKLNMIILLLLFLVILL